MESFSLWLVLMLLLLLLLIRVVIGSGDALFAHATNVAVVAVFCCYCFVFVVSVVAVDVIFTSFLSSQRLHSKKYSLPRLGTHTVIDSRNQPAPAPHHGVLTVRTHCVSQKKQFV